MAQALPERPSLDWLKKTAKQKLRELRVSEPAARLARAQLGLARDYGFPSWRALKAHVDRLSHSPLQQVAGTSDAQVALFLRRVGAGQVDAVRAMLDEAPQLVNGIGPHPWWGGRPQALHVSIETRRRDVFDLLLAAGADVDGSNDSYEHWSPLMLTVDRDRPDMRRTLLERGASVGLFEALLFADDALVEQLLRRGKAALPKAEPGGGSILALARTAFAIDRLLELGASHERRDRWGATPMEALSRLGPAGRPLVLHLLKRGVQAEPPEYARLGDRDALAALVAADPAIARANSVMMGAVDFGHHALVQWLLERGADANARAAAQSGQTALHSAAWNGDLRMVKLLIAAGANAQARDREYDNTPAGWARVAIEVANNPRCREVADYLEGVAGSD